MACFSTKGFRYNKKTDVRRLYRLSKKDDLQGIPFRTEQTTVEGTKRLKFIYKERDIERKSWEKHGGPEGFDKYLAGLKETYHRTHGSHAHFSQPKTYNDPYPRLSIHRLKPSTSQRTGPLDVFIETYPSLSSIKKQMEPWFWTAYNEALFNIDVTNDSGNEGANSSGQFASANARAGPMKDALVMMPTYPTRPTEQLASSASVDRVRAVLADAASLPSTNDWRRKDLPGLVVILDYDDEDEVEPTYEYRWSDDYVEHLFAALIEVVEEHGTGAEGFEGIRWEVYDKYVKAMMVGPRYDQHRKMWMDDPAGEWLDGQFASLETTYRGKCSAGKRFNEMLPRLNPQGSRSVGIRPG